jgi:predicted transglutaminase-like cysteine proteinase
MLSSIAKRRAGYVLTFALAAVLLAAQGAEAATKQKPSRRGMEFTGFEATVPTMPRIPQQSTGGAPVRFFTINDVLARRDNGGSRSDALRVAHAGNGAGVTDTPSPVKRASPMGDEPFGLFTFRAPEGLLWTKWRGVEADIRAEAKLLDACRTDAEACRSPAAKRFVAMIREASKHSGIARIDVVNRAVNGAIRYTSDFAQHGQADYWSSPLAALAAERGDCEDYAIAKYVALREAGVSTSELRLLLVRDRAVGQDHAVLAVRHESEWLILDNRHTAMNQSTSVPQFTPLFAIDHQGVKLFASPYAQRPVPQESDVELAPATSAPNASALPALTASPLLI